MEEVSNIGTVNEDKDLTDATKNDSVGKKEINKTKGMVLSGLNQRSLMVDIIAFSICFAVLSLDSSFKLTEEANKQFMYVALACISISFAINVTVDTVAIAKYKLWPCCGSKKIEQEEGDSKNAGIEEVKSGSEFSSFI
ncbi:MAG: hypothetical protein MHPSP_002818 [Paramarteilia canceri]